MGLGLHGGGLASARFFAGCGAHVTVTDLRSEEVLAPTLARLSGLDIRFVLSRHDEEDFRKADIVIKNPAVKRSSPYLAHARRVETDLSIFFRECSNPVIGVTGTKGKSTSASAVSHILKMRYPGTRLGGNITVSPLEFIDELTPDDPVVLEVSSFQLGDLAFVAERAGSRNSFSFSPRIALVTNILPDHQDYYGSMESYVADKRVIFEHQKQDCFTVCNADDEYGRQFARQTPGVPVLVSTNPEIDADLPDGPRAWMEGNKGYMRLGNTTEQILPEEVLLPGSHMRRNLLFAAVAARLYGLERATVEEGARTFRGIEHRLELVAEIEGVRYYNDSAATIPEAAVKAVSSFDRPVHLIAGGTDKNIDFAPFGEIGFYAAFVYLLAGSATDKIRVHLDAAGVSYEGPFNSLSRCIDAAAARARSGEIVLLSPGCASFGMFNNEFDRGLQYKQLVLSRGVGRGR